MPRPPTRPTVDPPPAWPFGSLAWALFQGPASTVHEQLSQLDAPSYLGLIAGLVWRLPPPLRRQASRRLRAFLEEYQRTGPISLPEMETARAFYHMVGGFERTGCHPLILRHHKALALDHLAGLRPWRPEPEHSSSRAPRGGRRRDKYTLADYALAIQARLGPLLKALAAVPCPCGQQRQDVPTLDVLRGWPHSIGQLAIEVLAWYHGKADTTMRDLLTRARHPTDRTIERRLRRLRVRRGAGPAS
jgi:hypothetical protein